MNIVYILNGQRIRKQPVILRLPDGLFLIKYIGIDRAVTEQEAAMYVQNKLAA